MTGFLLHVGATMTCPHAAGQVTIVPSQMRVTVSGQPVATTSDQCLVAGCPFTVPPPKPQPCMTILWMVPSLRVKVMGTPVLTRDSVGICQSADQIPAGPPIVAVTQVRAGGM